MSSFTEQQTRSSNLIGGQVCNPRTRTCRNKQPLLRVMTPDQARFVWLHHGRAGNLETAAEMAALVREDAWRDEGLKQFAVKLLADQGLDSHSNQNRILDTLLSYTQRIRYISDSGGEFDAIHSARETLSKGYGDCDDLSVLLATFLALLGFSPSFVLARYRRANDGFDHVYVEVQTKQGRVALDPTSRMHGVGWEKPQAIERVTFPIFGISGGMNGLAGPAQALTTGAAVGLNFVPVVGPFLSAAVGPIASLFDKSQQRAYEQARDQMWADTVKAAHGLQADVEACKLDPQTAAAQARQILAAFYQNCDRNLNSKVAQTCRNYDADATSYIATMEKSPGCGANAAASNRAITPGMVGSQSASGLGGLSVSLPTILLLAGAAYLLTK